VADATPPVDASAFRRLVARWATGVSVVTAHDRGVDGGLTVNALLSVSLTPPSLLVSVTRDADTTPLIERSRRFAATLLAADQRGLSERFAQTLPPAEKFRGVDVHRSPSGLPLLNGGLAVWECRVVDWLPRYDHVLIVGEIVHQEVGRDADPLVFFRSGYAETDGAGRLHLPAPK
jgi:flavin reductase (DIM6/NTAB) family NADH-FMN oxidoreductase RutF